MYVCVLYNMLNRSSFFELKLSKLSVATFNDTASYNNKILIQAAHIVKLFSDNNFCTAKLEFNEVSTSYD